MGVGPEDETVRMPPGSGFAAAPGAVRHHYPLAVRSASLATAFGLLMRTLPYALARFGIMLAATIATIIWIVIVFGGAAFLGTHIAQAFGWLWFILCLLATGFFWSGILRYLLHLVAAGHTAVLTDLITKDTVGNGNEGMFAYGIRVVREKFIQINLLYVMKGMARAVVAALHRTLDFIAGLLPIPGLDGLAKLIDIVLRAATRYLDEVILSYTLARGDNPWTCAREGLVYYAQNAKPILMTAVRIAILERVLTVVMWLLLLAPAGLITVMLPASARESGGLVTILIAILLAGSLRAAFVKPLFLIIIMVRYHALIENQPIQAEWDHKLAEISSKFREFGERAAGAVQSGPSPVWSWPGARA